MNQRQREMDRVREAYAQRAGLSTRYSLYDCWNVAVLQARERAVLGALRREFPDGLAGLHILDLGCGTGGWLRDLIRWGASPEQLVGVDLLSDRIERAQQSLPASVDLRAGSGDEIALESGAFDLVILATVLSSVLDSTMRASIAAEVRRVLRPGGRILCYDFRWNNPRNPDVRGVKKDELRRLFPAASMHARRLTLLPPLGRRVAPWSHLLYEFLEAIPLLCSHDLSVLRVPDVQE